MRQSIKGIYLNHFPYSETSAIIKVFTQDYGLQSFIAKGIKKKKGASAVLQPFHLLEIDCSYNPNKSLNYAGLIKLQKPPASITMDLRKSMVAIFLTEILYKCIKEEESNTELYEYISTAISIFDESEFNANFHLVFLMGLSRYFGFQPSLPEKSSQKYFSLKEGVFEFPKDIYDYHLSVELSESLRQLIGTKFATILRLNYSNFERKQLLGLMVNYYEMQLGMKKDIITSHKILETIFED
jgi:DNA repair protein RecO (recombination protein O)